MADSTDPATTRGKLHRVMGQLNETFVNRADAVRVIVLAWLAQSHYLFVGDPGTGKTALVKCAFSHVEEARFFDALMGAFTPPDELFGPIDIKAFQQGQWARCTAGRLPEAEFAFLDEGFKANDGVLNTLLRQMNERTFEGRLTPLLSCGMATNWPEIEARSPNVAAFYDRILLRCIVEDVRTEEDTVALLAAIGRVGAYVPATRITLAELRAAAREVEVVEVPVGIRRLLHSVRNRLAGVVDGKKRIDVSARRLGQLQRVLQASAWLAGRDAVAVDDFDALRFGLWNDRRDVERVDAVLATIDQEAVKALVELIDSGRQEYEKLARTGFGAARVNDVATRIKEIVVEVRNRLDDPTYTERGRADVANAMAALKVNFQELNRRARSHTEKAR